VAVGADKVVKEDLVVLVVGALLEVQEELGQLGKGLTAVVNLALALRLEQVVAELELLEVTLVALAQGVTEEQV
jgi:hypothetical protein